MNPPLTANPFAKPVDIMLRRLKETPIDPARVARGLEKFMALTDRFEAMSDVELAEVVIEKVWGQLVLGSEEDAALDELIKRFEAAKGIKRDDDGRVIPP